MPYSFDQQHNREFLTTLTTEEVTARYNLLTALLEDLHTFASIDGLYRDLVQWHNAHHTIVAERTHNTEELSSIPLYRYIRYLAFRTPFSATVIATPDCNTTSTNSTTREE